MACQRTERRDSDRGDFVKIAATSETLGQSGQECAAWAELGGKDPEPLAGTDLVDLVEQVDDVEAQFHSLKEAGGDRLDNAEIHLLITRQAGAVRDGAVRPKAATGDQIDGKTGIIRRKRILDAGRGCVGLVMIEVDVMTGDKGQIVRREVELGRGDVLSLGFGSRKITVERPVFDVVAKGQLNAANQPLLVVEWGQKDWSAELPLVEQVAGDLVVGVDPGLEPGKNDLRGAEIEVMVSFRLGNVV